jgi:four helix bundle protein
MSDDKNAYQYKKLKVWQKAMKLVVQVYKATRNFPKNEQYGLVSQMRRSVISIPSNIAEGHGRSSDKEIVRFLDIARGSIFELDTQIEISKRLNFLDIQEYNNIFNMLDEISRMLSGLKKSKSQN